MKTIHDVAGQPIQFDEVAAQEKAVQFLNDRFPGSQGKHSAATIKRAVGALERQARGAEIGALEREF